MITITGLATSPRVDKAAPMRREKKIKGRISMCTMALKTFEGIIPSLPVSSLPRNTSLMVPPMVRSVFPDILEAMGRSMLNPLPELSSARVAGLP